MEENYDRDNDEIIFNRGRLGTITVHISETYLNLHCSQLKIIPPEIYSLKSLTILDLSNN